MKRITIAAVTAALLLGGCVAPQASQTHEAPDTQTAAAQPAADGELQDGGRVIALSGDIGEARAYRGETVTLVYSGDGEVTLEVPELEAQASGSGEVRVHFKAARTGSFEIVVQTRDGVKTGRVVVEELAETSVFKSVDAAEFAAQMTGSYVLLDVRTQAEYDAGAIEGALLIPHTELADRLDELEGTDKALVYCASGNRSIAASQILIGAGVKEVYNLKGGYAAWQADEP